MATTDEARRWDEELGALGAALEAAEGALARGDHPDAIAAALPVSAPAAMPPLPASHRDRAELVLGHVEHLRAVLTERLASLGTALARSQRTDGRAQPAPARYIDQAL